LKFSNFKFQIFLGAEMTDQDQEVTLGTGRLLGLFFGLVIICALFFSLGFSLGRRSTPESVSAATASAPAIPTSGGAKPSPMMADTAVKPECATPGACPQENVPKSTSDELTFYKAVEQNEPKAKLEPAAAPPAPAPSARKIEPKTAPEMTKPVALGAGYMVQVAAVTKQDDAEALVNALRKKSYPVITTNGPADKLYHVQVGPFPDMKEAEATRSKLISDGYNPILKK
jgi:cell division septation protein DedD